jgi:hypothetical protein
MVPMIRNRSNLILLAIFVTGLLHASLPSAPTPDRLTFEQIYENSALWPDFLTPVEDVISRDGEKLLSKGIRCTLVRLLPDGRVIVHDRNGNIVIDHELTDLIKLASDRRHSEKHTTAGRIQTILGRRIFNPALDEKRALLEETFDGVERFLIVNLDSSEDQVRLADAFFRSYDNEKRRGVVTFERTLISKEYYTLLTTNGIAFTSIIPIFNEGMNEYFFSKEDEGFSVIEIDKNGKLISRHKSFEEYIKISGIELPLVK